jgi:hypothetical protein
MKDQINDGWQKTADPSQGLAGFFIRILLDNSAVKLCLKVSLPGTSLNFHSPIILRQASKVLLELKNSPSRQKGAVGRSIRTVPLFFIGLFPSILTNFKVFSAQMKISDFGNRSGKEKKKHRKERKERKGFYFCFFFATFAFFAVILNGYRLRKSPKTPFLTEPILYSRFKYHDYQTIQTNRSVRKPGTRQFRYGICRYVEPDCYCFNRCDLRPGH